MKKNGSKFVNGSKLFCRSMTDPQGSYTGVPEEKGEIPVQDADDL